MAKKVAKKGVRKASTNSRPRAGAKKKKKAAAAKAPGQRAATRAAAAKKSSGRPAKKAGVKGKASASAKGKTSTSVKSKASTSAKGKAPSSPRGKGLTQVKSRKAPRISLVENSAGAGKSPATRTRATPTRPMAERPARATSETTTAVAEPSPRREPLSDAQLRQIKSGLTRSETHGFHKRLMTKRFELIGDVEALENDARTDSGDHFSPEHMADIGSNAYDQEFTLGLVESEQKLLREIDEALLRIANRTYGVCAETGEPIGKPRLEAKPWAKYCIEVAREKERLGQM